MTDNPDRNARLRALLEGASDGKLASAMAAVHALDAESMAVTSRLHVLRNFSIEPIAPWVALEGYRRGVRIETSFGGYDTVLQESMTGTPALAQADAVLVALWLESLPQAFGPGGALDAPAALEYVEAILAALRERTAATLLLSTTLPPVGTGPSWPGAEALDEVNRGLRVLAKRDPRVGLLDVARLAAHLGLAHAVDGRRWAMHRAPWSQPLLRAAASPLSQRLAAEKGRARKVLVLDCDNTLWGGVVGEDGPSGLALSPGDPRGDAFRALQARVLELRARGVLLALASKNEERDVLEVLDRHPGMLLRREHLAGWRIGWGPKSENLRSLAAELRLGLDAFVFVDDSPVECAEVRAALPMVEVLQTPAAVGEIAGMLATFDRFDAPYATAEDALRVAAASAEKAREEAARSFTDVRTFLASLELRVTFEPPGAENLPRLAQLTQRTNQFNLTTRRRAVGELETLAARSDHLCLGAAVRDRFGDSGLTALAIAVDDRDDVRIETFLQSCRVIGRGVESAVLAELVARARERFGDKRILGEYVPSAKNAQVADFYPRHGFVEHDRTGARVLFALPPGRTLAAPAHITLDR